LGEVLIDIEDRPQPARGRLSGSGAEEHAARPFPSGARGYEQPGDHGQLVFGPAQRAGGDLQDVPRAVREQRDMPGDVPVQVGNPGTVCAGKDKERLEVPRQEAGVAVECVDFTHQVGAGRNVAVPARAYQHPHILTRWVAIRRAGDPGAPAGGGGEGVEPAGAS
jgi:hypothetical protein